MTTMKYTLAAFATGCLLAMAADANDEVALEGAEPGRWTMDFEAATKLAAERELPMMINFTGSDWCGWCKLMDKEVFAKDEWKKFAAEHVVLVTLDFPKDKSIVPEKFVARNKKLKEQFGVRGYPTYIVLDSDGETKIGKLGAGKGKTPSSFIKEFQGVIRMSQKSIDAYAKAHPDQADAYKKAIRNLQNTEQALKDWLATKPARNEDNNKKFSEFQERIRKARTALEAF